MSVFNSNLLLNIRELHQDLKNKVYVHGEYYHFKINDPKSRDIHKALVRDRLLHHAIYRVLYPFFDRTFIHDSYSCRNGRGTHKGFKRFSNFAYRASFGHTKTIWTPKCDIKKFFASIDHEILFNIINQYITDIDIIWLIKCIVNSFHTTKDGVGLPLGNLTSQLFVNIYLNEFDKFIKHKLKIKWYIRYADDFIILDQNREKLEYLIIEIKYFLESKLHLNLHPNKVFIKTFSSGIDYLGWVHFPYHRVLRTSTKNRMFKNMVLKEGRKETVQSYLGLLRHGDAFKLENKVKNFTTQKLN